MSMDAVEFINARDRMIKETGSAPTVEYTHARPAEEIVAIVEKWAREHPAKTRQSEFLKMFPTARKNSDGVIDIQPCEIDTANYENGAFRCGRTNMMCDECKREFWGQEVE